MNNNRISSYLSSTFFKFWLTDVEDEMVQVDYIRFSVNGVEYTVTADDIGPSTPLNSYLRETLHLTGTKKMCFEGGCGTCTVAVEQTVNGKTNSFSVFSCLVPVVNCDGWKISTVEGIGNPLKGYHQIQTTLCDNDGTQCGYCSPGMVMNMYALHQSGRKTKKEIENAFGGNICRCTGYRPILHAFQQLASDADNLSDIEDLKICPSTGGACTNRCKKNETTMLKFGDVTWIKVNSFNELLSTLKTATTNNYMLIFGDTAKGVYKHGPSPDLYIDVHNVSELTTYSINDQALTLGGNTTLSEFINICRENSKKNNFSFLETIEEHLNLVATLQIRNVGSLAGNLMMKYTHNSFQSDIFVILETFDATLLIADVNGKETSISPQDFLKFDMTKKVIKTIILKALNSECRFSSYKIMPRSQNVVAMVNAGFLIQLNNNIVQSARIVYGGVNPNFIHATQTENLLVGQDLYSNATLQKALQALSAEIVPDYILPDASPEYRKNLAVSLFYKFVLKTCPGNLIADKYKSGGSLLDRSLSSGTQVYSTNKEEWPLTQPITKVEGLAQCSGQAEYTGDIPLKPNEVFCNFVTAKAPAGSVILEIDASKALEFYGVIAFYDKTDIPGLNTFTPTGVDAYNVMEELFCSGTVQYYHQPIGIIIATEQYAAFTAAELVTVKYAPPKTKIYINVKDVVADNVKDRINLDTSVTPKRRGNDTKQVIKGEFYVGHQYHYHMEVQSCKVVPTEDGIDIFPASQWMDGNQLGASAALNLPMNKINVKVRRLGGGFGGKMVRSGLISTATALVAYKLRRPATMIMTFEQNMEIIGKRYPLYMKYEVGVNNSGVIQYLDADLYSDFGCGGNEPIAPVLVASFQNCYDTDTFKFSTYHVKTDIAPNCYTRAPGTLEGQGAIESILEHIACTLDLDAIDVKLANVKMPNISKYWTDLQAWSKVTQRKQELTAFNKINRWKKRGLSIVPMKWILEVGANYSVLVSVFHGDGGVAISHGGIEMGQGINTKVAQVCAYKFGITLDKVTIKPSYNFIAPNSSASGGSLTSEAVSYAVIKACDTILERMKPIRDQMTNPSWVDLVNKCFQSDIQLVATGFFTGESPGIQNYPIYGICACTVEIDILTGNHEILQVDIIEDLGESMSPLIDIGQIEGAFVMGIGYYLTEEIIHDKEGQLLTNRTWNYSPPGALDIPIKFNIKFTENDVNPVGVLKSKAVAEPPICLSVAVPLAIRNALGDARAESDSTQAKWIPFDGPTTVEKTFMNSLNDVKQYLLN